MSNAVASYVSIALRKHVQHVALQSLYLLMSMALSCPARAVL